MTDYSNIVAALASQCPSAKVDLAEETLGGDIKGVTVGFDGYIIVAYDCGEVTTHSENHWLVDLISEDGDVTNFEATSELDAAFKAINLYRAYI